MTLPSPYSHENLNIEENNLWVTKGIKISKQNLIKYNNELKLNHSLAIYKLNYIKKYKRTYRKVIRAAKLAFNSNYIARSKYTNQATWKVINDTLGVNSEVNIESLCANNNMLKDPIRIADAFNAHFLNPQMSTGTNQNNTGKNNVSPVLTIQSNENSIFLEPVTRDEVNEIVKKTKEYKLMWYRRCSIKSYKKRHPTSR